MDDKKAKSAPKSKDLSHVPCKFYKVGGCTAGSSCPFSHSTGEPGQAKETCTWFVKGNCKFGHKCALAHILPGQSMSMDRKNKKAAQQAAQQQQGGSNKKKSGSKLPLLAGGSTAPTKILNSGSSKERITATISPSQPAPPVKDTEFALDMEGLPQEDQTPPASLPAPLPPSAPRSSTNPPPTDFGPIGSPPRQTNPISSSHPIFPATASAAQPSIAASLGNHLDYEISYEYDEFSGTKMPLKRRPVLESAVEDEDLDVIPGSLTDLLTPEERKRRLSRSNSGQPQTPTHLVHQDPTLAATATTNAALGHRYSRSVPAVTFLNDPKNIWSDPASAMPSSPPVHRGTPTSRFDPLGSTADDLGVGVGGTPSSAGILNPTNASAAFLGFHNHYLASKQQQQTSNLTAGAPGGISRVLRGTSNPLNSPQTQSIASTFLQPVSSAKLGLPSSTSSSTLHTHIHAATGATTTYRTTPSPFDLTQGVHSMSLHPQTPRLNPPSTAAPSTTEDPHLHLSPSTRALHAHAPGQSLPQGLAAGYSRIHALPPLPNIVSPPTSGSFVGSPSLNEVYGISDWANGSIPREDGFGRMGFGAYSGLSAGVGRHSSQFGAPPPGLGRNATRGPPPPGLSPLAAAIPRRDDDELFDMDK